MYGCRDEWDGRLKYYIIVVLLTLVGAAFMTATGALCKNMEMSNAIGVTIVVLFMLFDGNWINLKNVPVYYRWLAHISPLGDAVEAIAVNELRPLTFSCPSGDAEDGCARARAPPPPRRSPNTGPEAEEADTPSQPPARPSCARLGASTSQARRRSRSSAWRAST